MIDKRTLEVVKTLTPEPGKTAAHVEFTATAATRWPASGRSTARSSSTTRRRFEEVKRIPMNKPVGKYNVFNKITRSEGTSH